MNGGVGGLPRMGRAGILEFDDDEGVVEPTERSEKVTVYLEVFPGDEIPWRGCTSRLAQ